MQTRSHLNALSLLLLLGAATAAEAQVQPELAKRYFEEATKLCERDAGRLWGVSLCGPLVIVDQRDRHACHEPAGTRRAGAALSGSRGRTGHLGWGAVVQHALAPHSGG